MHNYFGISNNTFSSKGTLKYFFIISQKIISTELATFLKPSLPLKIKDNLSDFSFCVGWGMRSPSLAAVSRDGQPAQRNGVLNGELQPPRATSGWGTAPAPLPPAPNGEH